MNKIKLVALLKTLLQLDDLEIIKRTIESIIEELDESK